MKPSSQDKPTEAYVIDTNIFLNFWKQDNDEPFGKDVHKSAWEYLEQQIEAGRIIAPTLVKSEIEKHGTTELLAWVKAHKSMFVEMKTEIIEPLSRIVKAHPAYKKARSSKADAMVVALASARGLGVITSEKEEPEGSRSTANPKIPNVCNDMKVSWYSATGFFRNEGKSF